MLAPDAFRLDAKVALITGAAVGLGRSMALAFAQYGADLVLCATVIEAERALRAEYAALAEHADSATPVVEWEQSHWMTYFNGFRIQIYPSRLDLGWWEFLVERDPNDPNERMFGQGTSKQAAMRGGIQAAKEWK